MSENGHARHKPQAEHHDLADHLLHGRQRVGTQPEPALH
jgi:hypothetical protein